MGEGKAIRGERFEDGEERMGWESLRERKDRGGEEVKLGKRREGEGKL